MDEGWRMRDVEGKRGSGWQQIDINMHTAPVTVAQPYATISPAHQPAAVVDRHALRNRNDLSIDPDRYSTWKDSITQPMILCS